MQTDNQIKESFDQMLLENHPEYMRMKEGLIQINKFVNLQKQANGDSDFIVDLDSVLYTLDDVLGEE